MKCPECGFDNLAELARCQQCGWRLAMMPPRPLGTADKANASIVVLERAPSSLAANGAFGNGEETKAAAADPHTETIVWRQEVSRRVRAFRSRRRQHIEGQEDFPFAHGQHPSDGATAMGRLGVASPRPRRREPERIELPLIQPTLAFEGSDPEPVPSLEPPAAVAERARAGLLDLAVVLTSYAAFFALFAGLGRELPLNKPGLAIYGLILVFYFAGYFFLFTAFGGRTPGMRIVGLELIRFDGAAPTFEDALWRTAGYLVSAGAFFLGFIWTFVDDRQLTWHDRISKTFIISARKPVEEAA